MSSLPETINKGISETSGPTLGGQFFVIRWNEKEKESKSSKQPANQQYIFQYKIQSMVPNTFTNKESVAQEDSLRYQLKNFNSLTLNCLGGL